MTRENPCSFFVLSADNETSKLNEFDLPLELVLTPLTFNFVYTVGTGTVGLGVRAAALRRPYYVVHQVYVKVGWALTHSVLAILYWQYG